MVSARARPLSWEKAPPTGLEPVTLRPRIKTCDRLPLARETGHDLPEPLGGICGHLPLLVGRRGG